MRYVLIVFAMSLSLAWAGQTVCAAGVPHKTVAAAAVHPKPAPVKVAPLDEYFGKMKMSPLGINNTIHDTNLRVHYDPAHAGQYYQTLEWAEDALHDWARKYPHDNWLPGRAYFMSHVFWQMHTPQADAAAERCRELLFRQFPTSHWAMLARHETKEIIAPVTAPSAAPAAKNP
jgi:TolA-binding protein